MIKSLIDPSKNFLWTIVHILMGVLCVFDASVIIFWFYLFIFSSLSKIISIFLYQNSVNIFIPFIIYISSFDVLGRMLKSSPFIPWELSKYFIIFVSIILLISNKIKIKMNLGFLLFILLIPSLIVIESPRVTFSDIASYLFGPLSMSLLIIILSNYKIDKTLFDASLRLIWLTSVTVLVYVILKTPDYADLSFSLSADFETTGGFGSNQISTILGVGMFLSFYAWMNKISFSSYHTLDGVFIGLFAYQGFLTFSRGGMVVSIFLTLVYYFLFTTSESYQKTKSKKKLKPAYYFLVAMAILIISFWIIQVISGGNVVLRYLGETNATLSGDKIKSINTVTTGRFAILLADLNLWYENFIFGVGAGASKFLRGNNLEGIAPHIEFSRMLAEHGVFGLLYLLILLFMGFKSYNKNVKDINRAIIVCMFLLGMGTAMHSSMRTFVTPIFIGMSTMTILKEEDEEP